MLTSDSCLAPLPHGFTTTQTQAHRTGGRRNHRVVELASARPRRRRQGGGRDRVFPGRASAARGDRRRGVCEGAGDLGCVQRGALRRYASSTALCSQPPPTFAPHVPVLEQLPLSLHRAFTLIQELDQQAQGMSSHPVSCHTPRSCVTEHISAISPAILKYVSIRRALASAAKEPQGQQE